MQSTSIRIYVALVTGLAAASFLFVDWVSLAPLGEDIWTGLLSLIILGLVSESLSLSVKVARKPRQFVDHLLAPARVRPAIPVPFPR